MWCPPPGLESRARGVSVDRTLRWMDQTLTALAREADEDADRSSLPPLSVALAPPLNSWKGAACFVRKRSGISGTASGLPGEVGLLPRGSCSAANSLGCGLGQS